MKYETENELFDVLAKFESGTISRDEWGHPEHLIVAFLYSRNSTLDQAYERMKKGLFALLRAFGVDLSKEMPYHETLTVFWMAAVHTFAEERSSEDTVTACRELVEVYDKGYPARFYSNGLLFSEEARAAFKSPDREPATGRDRALLKNLRAIASTNSK